MGRFLNVLKLFYFSLLLWSLCCQVKGRKLKFSADIVQRNSATTDSPQPTNVSTAASATTLPSNSTTNTTAAPATKSGWQGYVGAVIAVVFFGSNFVPVKKFETGDGVFFQWVFCSAIWSAGLITNCALGSPKFHPLVMLGGFLWATGNVCVVPVIKTIGLGLGLLIWGSFNLLSGWASGRFGWFGVTPEPPGNALLNDLAIAFAMLSALCWMFVKSQPNLPISLDDDDDDEPPLLSDESYKELADDPMVTTRVHSQGIGEIELPGDQNIPWEMRMSATQRRIFGIVLSIFSGLLYGLAFTPAIYVKDQYHGASDQDVDYVFAQFCGIYATSSLYFLIYCIVKKNQPMVYPRVILPAIVSGLMWAAADIGWFVANTYLSEPVSFPIITTGPGIIASIWGVFVFHEVKGHRNYLIMGMAYALTITGAVLAGLSKT